MHALPHTTSVFCKVCVWVSFLCTVTHVLTIITPGSFLACRVEVTRVTFTTSCFSPHLSHLVVQRSLSSGIHVCSVCQQDLGCRITQEIADFSFPVFRSTAHYLKRSASLSQCLPKVCPCSGTQNVDTAPQGPSARPSSLRGRSLSHTRVQERLSLKGPFLQVRQVCFDVSMQLVRNRWQIFCS